MEDEGGVNEMQFSCNAFFDTSVKLGIFKKNAFNYKIDFIVK